MVSVSIECDMLSVITIYRMLQKKKNEEKL